MKSFTGNSQQWNDLIGGLPGAHFLQTWQWSQVKGQVGWKAHPRFWQRDGHVVAAAMILERTLPIGGFAARLRVQYSPKGPLLDWSDEGLRRQVLDDVQSFARRRGAIFFKMDPDIVLGTGLPAQPEAVERSTGWRVRTELVDRNWRFSKEQIQFRNTVMIDLQASEDEMLARMKQKTRYNIRLAARKGVTVRPAGELDLPALYAMYAETATRDGFVIRPRAYYLDVWQRFIGAGIAEPLLAEVDGEAVAGVVIFRFAGLAWYFYGMSRAVHREKMPNYLLQWEAMRRAKSAGCRMYDLWGAPDDFDDLQDGLQGVFRFKQGLGGQVVRTLGAWDFPARPFFYRLYGETLPRLMDVLRRRRVMQVKREAQG